MRLLYFLTLARSGVFAPPFSRGAKKSVSASMIKPILAGVLCVPGPDDAERKAEMRRDVREVAFERNLSNPGTQEAS